MSVGKVFLAPVAFAMILSMALAPVCNWLDKLGVHRVLSIVLTYVALALLLAIIVTLISMTFVNIYQELPQIKVQIEEGFVKLNETLSEFFNFTDNEIQNYLRENRSRIFGPAWSFIEGTFSSSLKVIGSIFLTLLFTFFLLLYRRGIKKVLLQGKSERVQQELSTLLSNIAEVVKNYALGLLIVMILLGTVNSIGLWIIGIKYAFFWGYLAGFMIIVPYVGTTLGGVLPFLYALATTDTYWQPIVIVIMYYSIQQIEGNFITPNVVGSKINVNPMVVISAMICGALIWGIAGMILALPVVGITKVILSHYKKTQVLGNLMSDKLSKFN
jgi:predicted PurR-regulated permease PerM